MHKMWKMFKFLPKEGFSFRIKGKGKMKEFIKKNKVNLVVMLCYSIITFIILLFHESWRDEAQAWLIARDLNIIDIFRQMKYEGHPVIWYLILVPFAKLGLPYVTVKIVSWLISNIAVWLILKKAPFNLILKILFIFSMPMIYLYPSISRSYCLIPLAITIVAIYFGQRHEKPIQYILSILFLANTHVIMYGMVGILLLLFYIEELLQNRKTNSKEQKKKVYISLIVIIVGLILTLIPIIISMLTNTDVSLTSNTSIFEDTKLKMENAYEKIMTGCFGENELILKIVAIALIILLCYEIRYHFKNALIIICTEGLQFLIYTYVYMGSEQRVSTLILLMMFIFWVQSNNKINKGNISETEKELINNQKYIKKQRRKARLTDIAEYILVFVLIINVVNGMVAVNKEIKTTYSSSYETAEWIKENLEDDSIFICTNMPLSSAIIPYIDKEVFWSPQTLDYFSFTSWDENYRTGYSLRDLQKRVKDNFEADQNLYLIYTYDFDEMTMNFLEIQGYITEIFESDVSVQEEYTIYKIEQKFMLAESI